jgi:hypothetical protein
METEEPIVHMMDDGDAKGTSQTAGQTKPTTTAAISTPEISPAALRTPNATGNRTVVTPAKEVSTNDTKWPEPEVLPDEAIAKTWFGELLRLGQRPADELETETHYRMNFRWLTSGMVFTQITDTRLISKPGMRLARNFWSHKFKVFGVRRSRDGTFYDAFFQVLTPKNPQYMALHADPMCAEVLYTARWVDLVANFSPRQRIGYDQLIREMSARDLVRRNVKLPEEDVNHIELFRRTWADFKPRVGQVQWIAPDLQDISDEERGKRLLFANDLQCRYLCDSANADHFSQALIKDVTWVTWMQKPCHLAGQLTDNKKRTVWFFYEGDRTTNVLWLASNALFLSTFGLDDRHRYTIRENFLRWVEERRKVQEAKEKQHASGDEDEAEEEDEEGVAVSRKRKNDTQQDGGGDRKDSANAPPVREVFRRKSKPTAASKPNATTLIEKDTDMNQADRKERVQQLAFGAVETTDKERQQLQDLAEIFHLDMKVIFPQDSKLHPSQVMSDEEYQNMSRHLQQMAVAIKGATKDASMPDDDDVLAQLDLLQTKLNLLRLATTAEDENQMKDEESIRNAPSSFSSSHSASSSTNATTTTNNGVAPMSD